MARTINGTLDNQPKTSPWVAVSTILWVDQPNQVITGMATRNSPRANDKKDKAAAQKEVRRDTRIKRYPRTVYKANITAICHPKRASILRTKIPPNQ